MNKRIDKKIHKKYLTDAAIELSQDDAWRENLRNLDIGSVVKIANVELPEAFYSLNPEASSRQLNYEIERVSLHSIPSSESGWWQVSENTIFFAIYPSLYKRPRYYAAIDS